MEQRWFIGAHADIGGGYRDRRLSDITLCWIQSKAAACGLALDPVGCPTGVSENYRAEVTDSYMRFLSGRFAKRTPRYYRPILRTQYGSETIDDTVYQRLRTDDRYRPQNSGFGKQKSPSAVA